MKFTPDSSTSRRFVLLAPSGAALRGDFAHVEKDAQEWQGLLHDMQCLRGRVYLQDGAITAKDLTDGRHIQSIDEESWHLLVVNASGRVVGCARYLQHHASISFNRLRIKTAALAQSREWSAPLRCAVESEIETARQNDFSYVEVGGWAIDEALRGTSDALRSVLFTYAWSKFIGGCLGLVMATHRNSSASILRRIGGRPLHWQGEDLPAYYDPQYKCEMEVLRFDSRLPNAKYAHAIEEIRAQIPSVQVVSGDSRSAAWRSFVQRVHMPAHGVIPWTAGGVVPAA